ncbi:hypothetical protein CHS0354_003967 [Potamilus streckersoni]|uniref:Uncharacterized protein n=1 Tax=Potamilus streckersoni TaxID=2493646 RepID=A0AAE0T8R0_9BIVA|nr:hypothetical protein CHS0354_003967 [Potamilus streckersoni]
MVNIIYFFDVKPNGENFIKAFFLNGSNLYDFRLSDGSLEKLEIYKSHLLVTAKNSDKTLITSYSIKTGMTTMTGTLPDTGNISAIKVFDENMRQNETG